MTSHAPNMRCRDGIGTASGIQVVPEPILSVETPSGPIMAVSVIWCWARASVEKLANKAAAKSDTLTIEYDFMRKPNWGSDADAGESMHQLRRVLRRRDGSRTNGM